MKPRKNANASPPRYPAGDLPEVLLVKLLEAKAKRPLVGKRLDEARAELARTDRKREWAKVQPDRDVCDQSLTATMFIARDMIYTFADIGQKQSEANATNASKPRRRIKVNAGEHSFSISHIIEKRSRKIPSDQLPLELTFL